MQKFRILPLFSALLFSLLVVLPSLLAQDATPQPAGDPILFNSKYIHLFVEFDQQFTSFGCPEDSPVQAFCLDVTGTTTSPMFGDLMLARSLVADRTGPRDEFDRVSIVSSGTLTDAEGVPSSLRSVAFCIQAMGLPITPISLRAVPANLRV